MKRSFISILTLASAGVILSCGQAASPPAPYGAVPSADQLKWQQLEYYMFAHFGPNTFTNMEWGDGQEDPRVFNPTGLDCRQWAATAKQAGMKGIIVTAKHHDGFCLWPSKYSAHTVRESAWRNGRGDVLQELSEACKEAGLKFGVYLSPWDRNHPAYGTPEYNRIFADMLTEVLTGYGAVFEQWFDGANGEGENGKKQAYDWALFHRTVYAHQPRAAIFSDVGPGCRWIGNEAGRAGATCWSRLDTAGFEPGSPALNADTLNSGNVFGAAWIPGEADVSIRPGWFYSPGTDDQVKSLDHLLDIYYTSVGRNANLLLNVPPDRSGRIHPNDSTRLVELRERLDAIFKTNLLSGAKVTASATRGGSAQFSAAHLLDESFDAYWTTDDTTTTASLVFDLPQQQTFNLILLQEYIPLGQRVARFSVERWDDAAASWTPLANATTIGYKRILRLPLTTAKKIRVNILQALACPVLSSVQLYNAE
jgi:alpha-L-fucosidase